MPNLRKFKAKDFRIPNIQVLCNAAATYQNAPHNLYITSRLRSSLSLYLPLSRIYMFNLLNSLIDS
jgi:hypothetical protein